MPSPSDQPRRPPRSMEEAMELMKQFMARRNDNSITQESTRMRFTASLMEFEAIAMVDGDLNTLRERSHMLLDQHLDAIQAEHAIVRDARDKFEGK